MNSLSRYILRQCLNVMLLVTGALTAAVWLAQSLRLVDLIVNRGLSAEMFLYLALLILPRFLDIVAADRRVHRGAVRLQPADHRKRAGGDARRRIEPLRPGQAGLDARRHRVSLPDDAVGLFPAGLQPRIQGSAIRDPQPLRLEPAAGRRVHDDLGQADDLYRRPQRARRGYRAVDRRRARSAAPGDDPRRAGRLCRYRRRFAHHHGQRQPPAIRPRDRQAVGADLRLATRSISTRCAMRREVRFRDAQERFLGELFFPPPDLDPATRRRFPRRGQPAPHHSAVGLQLCDDPARLPVARRIQPPRPAEPGADRDRLRAGVPDARSRRQESGGALCH